MLLPKNGRIVIIDDKIEEALPLIKILSKKRIPFNYYSGTNSEELPNNAEDNKLRVLFLDLNIFELNTDARSVISSIYGILNRIIPSSPHPYLLIIWSKKNNEYQTALEELFANKLIGKAPANIIFLQKANYFDYIDGNWIEQEDCLEKIINDLNNELENISILKNLIAWENITHKNTCDTISEFSSFYPMTKQWDKNTKAIIYRLAKAIIGNDDLGDFNDSQKLAKAFMSINSFLQDKIESDVERQLLGSVIGIVDGIVPENVLAMINSRLHTFSKEFSAKYFEPGNLYQIPNERELVERIIWEKKFKGKRTDLINSFPLLVQLDITPACDYSQNKAYVRTIYGVVLDKKFLNDCKGKEQYYYITPIMIIQGEERFIIWDFRFIETFTKDFLIQRAIAPALKLRKEICIDIQSQLANQVNRPGISNV